ncbi:MULTISPECIES: hypothetical protein [unclassified Methylobacterium]|uniref:hypothetical protein n=1 Tax=unclassified Methylobacterium TaxID=2615210 RepID=UPI00135243B8|nr:hypothetical protein [Methylobacterium sp. 2A]MWV22097.1 hypothetical protein [Methylobacterium sp. 2A]
MDRSRPHPVVSVVDAAYLEAMMALPDRTGADKADQRKGHSVSIRTLILVPIAAGLIASLFARFGLSFFDNIQPKTLDYLTALFSVTAWGALLAVEAFERYRK